MAPKFRDGWHFHPTDAELMDFLLYKVVGVPLLSHDYIAAADLYGDDEPWEISGDAEEELYFFTKLKKIGGSSSTTKNASRNVGRGTWTNKSMVVPVFGKRGGVLGYRRPFRCERNMNDDDRKGTWPVKEEYKDCVLKRKRAKKDWPSGIGMTDQGPDVERGFDDKRANIRG